MLSFSRRAVLAAAAVALARPRLARAADATVGIDNFSFNPATLAVPAGSKVTWTNHDDIPHTVTSAVPAKLFHSGPLDTDDVFSFTFDKPGTYTYFCALHPHMQGKIVVT